MKSLDFIILVAFVFIIKINIHYKFHKSNYIDIHHKKLIYIINFINLVKFVFLIKINLHHKFHKSSYSS